MLSWVFLPTAGDRHVLDGFSHSKMHQIAHVTWAMSQSVIMHVTCLTPCRWAGGELKDLDSCSTLESGSPCHFPFQHNGFLHYKCIPLTPQVSLGSIWQIAIWNCRERVGSCEETFSPQGRQQCPVSPDSPTSDWEHCKVHPLLAHC